jgi:hypothetical protein
MPFVNEYVPSIHLPFDSTLVLALAFFCRSCHPQTHPRYTLLPPPAPPHSPSCAHQPSARSEMIPCFCIKPFTLTPPPYPSLHRHYKLDKLLGEGTFGAVYAGFMKETNTKVRRRSFSLEALLARSMMGHASCLSQHTNAPSIPLGWLPASHGC